MPFVLQYRLVPGCLDKMAFETAEDQSEVLFHPCSLDHTDCFIKRIQMTLIDTDMDLAAKTTD